MSTLALRSAPGDVSVVIRGGTIVFAGAEPPKLRDDAIPCAGTQIAPGAVNAHTHIYSALAPLGMPPPEPPPETFLEILESIWWRLDKALDERSLRAAARLYVAEALLAGTTTLVDHHESPSMIEGSLDIIADTCQELGMRALLCYGATERNGGVAEAERGLQECRRFITWNRRPLVRGAIGLHASFTVSDSTIVAAGDLCRELAVPLHVHVAEDLADVADAERAGYSSPLERLRLLRALVPNSIVAHAVHLGRRDIETGDALRVWFVQNPRSNRNNRVGYPRALAASSRTALGTDGFPADMTAEMDALLVDAATAGDDPRLLAARAAGGHRLIATAFSQSFAPLAAGGAADLCVRADGVVRHVIVDGQVVVRDGRLTRADIDEIRSDAVSQAQRLWERMDRRQTAGRQDPR